MSEFEETRTVNCPCRGDSDDPELPSQWPRQHGDGGKPALPPQDDKATQTHKTITRLPEPSTPPSRESSVLMVAAPLQLISGLCYLLARRPAPMPTP